MVYCITGPRPTIRGRSSGKTLTKKCRTLTIRKMNKPELPKSPALLVLDCIYELFSAFVMWRKKNDDYFLAKKAIKDFERAEEEAREKAADVINEMRDGE